VIPASSCAIQRDRCAERRSCLHCVSFNDVEVPSLFHMAAPASPFPQIPLERVVIFLLSRSSVARIRRLRNPRASRYRSAVFVVGESRSVGARLAARVDRRGRVRGPAASLTRPGRVSPPALRPGTLEGAPFA
jgi:hypothetical protein